MPESRLIEAFSVPPPWFGRKVETRDRSVSYWAYACGVELVIALNCICGRFGGGKDEEARQLPLAQRQHGADRKAGVAKATTGTHYQFCAYPSNPRQSVRCRYLLPSSVANRRTRHRAFTGSSSAASPIPSTTYPRRPVRTLGRACYPHRGRP